MAEVSIPETVQVISAPNIVLLGDDGNIVKDQTIAFLLTQLIYQVSRVADALEGV